MDPVTYGDYPASMHKYVGNRLPKFASEEAEMVKNSYDFLGLNYYTSAYAANIVCPDTMNRSYEIDSHVRQTGTANKPVSRVGYEHVRKRIKYLTQLDDKIFLKNKSFFSFFGSIWYNEKYFHVFSRNLSGPKSKSGGQNSNFGSGLRVRSDWGQKSGSKSGPISNGGLIKESFWKKKSLIYVLKSFLLN